MKSLCRRLAAVLAMFCAGHALAAPYPDEAQLRKAVGSVSGILKNEGLELNILDARKEGLTQPLLAAGLNLETGVCLVFYNTKPEDGLVQFFASITEQDLPVWLAAIAVHEATHCVEQREAYLRQRFDKVLPPDFKREGMTVQGYLSMVKSGVVETWGEALADIASVLYLKEAVPAQWLQIANGLAKMREDLARKWPEHDTSPWLHKVIAAEADKPAGQNLFEAAFRLRRQYKPG